MSFLSVSFFSYHLRYYKIFSNLPHIFDFCDTHLFSSFFNICEIRKHPTIDDTSSFNWPSFFFLVIYEIMMNHTNSGVLDLMKNCICQHLSSHIPRHFPLCSQVPCCGEHALPIFPSWTWLMSFFSHGMPPKSTQIQRILQRPIKEVF